MQSELVEVIENSGVPFKKIVRRETNFGGQTIKRCQKRTAG